MFPNMKMLKVLFILICVFFAKQATYAQDFQVLLSSFAPQQDTTCIGDSLELNIEIRYSGTNTLNASSGILDYFINNDTTEEPMFFQEKQVTWGEINEVPESGLVLSQSVDTIIINHPLFQKNSDNIISVRFTADIEEENLNNNSASDTTFVNCELVDFETELEPFEPEQDTLCVGENLTINGGIRYNGSEAITVDTLYLNYYVGQEGADGNTDDLTPVQIDTLLNRTFEPNEFVPRSLNYSISDAALPTGSTGFVLIWPTTTRSYLDTSPENDVSIDSTEIACQLVDFETELEPFEPEQDTLCVGENLTINGGIRYNGSEAITVDTLYLNYYVGQEGADGNTDDLTPVQIDTLLNRTFEPNEFVPRSLNYSISDAALPTGSTGFVLIWPTTTRSYLDTSPENDVSIDSTEIACQLVDFETELEPFEPEQDTLCVGENLTINGGIRYNGSEAITVDTLYLNYYVGQEGADGNTDDLTPVQIDTLLNRTFEPNEFVPRSLNYSISDVALPAGSTGFVLIWPTTTRSYLDTSPENDVSIDSLSIECVPNLPLNLLSFTGSYADKQVELEWKVSLWDEGNYFDIERSNDGLNFELINKINAIANEQANTYKYRDDNPYFITTYYRLKMVDISGEIKYSPILAVKKDYQNTLSIDNIYIDDNQLKLTYSSTDNAQLIALLYDSMGRLIHSEVITNTQIGFNEHRFYIKGLSTGIYVFSLQSESETISRIFRR